MQGIYQVKNKTNGKSYIGQSIDIHIRWSEHINSAFNKGHQSHEYPLPRAIRKHGVEAFEFLVLEETVKERLTEKETYWYKQIEPEYNQILPKDSSGGTAKEVYQIDIKTLKILATFSSSQDAQRQTGVDSSNIRKVCRRVASKAGGFYWCLVEDYRSWAPRLNQGWRPVLQIDKEGKVINSFISINEASRETGCHQGSIVKVCKGQYKSSGGFGWRYVS